MIFLALSASKHSATRIFPLQGTSLMPKFGLGSHLVVPVAKMNFDNSISSFDWNTSLYFSHLIILAKKSPTVKVRRIYIIAHQPLCDSGTDFKTYPLFSKFFIATGTALSLTFSSSLLAVADPSGSSYRCLC